MSWFSEWLHGDDQQKSIQESGEIYKNYYDQALQHLQQQEAASLAGLGGITTGTERAIGYERPYLGMGQRELGAYETALGFPTAPGTPTAQARFRESPGYQFALQQGLTGVQRGMGAIGLTGSGPEALALQKTATGLAEQEYQPYISRLGQLAGLTTGMGERAAELAGRYAFMGPEEIAQEQARLRLGYTGYQIPLYTALAGMESQVPLAKERAREQQKSGFWGDIGKVVGTISSIL